VRFGFSYDPQTNRLETISTYGRFNYPGQKSNISQGGGVIAIKVIKDEAYEKAQKNIRPVR
jgi:hypothetical protein